MAQVLQLRRNTTVGLSTERGSIGEITIDTTKNTVVVMDGSTNGGTPLAKESDIPVRVSDLTNDAGYLTSSEVFSGSYTDLTNKPTLFGGAYADLTGKPTLFSGDYNDLTNKPTLFSGAYADLTDKPTLFDGQFSSLTGRPTTISGYGITDAFNGQYDSLTGKPDLSAISTALQPNTSVSLSSINVTNSVSAASFVSNQFSGNQNTQFTTASTSGVGYAVTLEGGASTGDVGGAVFINGGTGSTGNGDINIGTVTTSQIVIGRPDSATEFFGSVTLPGYISLSTLKTTAAASIDFADFQAKIAAL